MPNFRSIGPFKQKLQKLNYMPSPRPYQSAKSWPVRVKLCITFVTKSLIAVVRQQFVMGINCSIFLYRNPFGGNQCLALTRKSFRIAQVSHCAVQRVYSSRRMFCSNGFDTMHVVCTDLKCVVCIGLLCGEFSTVNTGLGTPMFWKPLCLLSTPESLATTNYQLT